MGAFLSGPARPLPVTWGQPISENFPIVIVHGPCCIDIADVLTVSLSGMTSELLLSNLLLDLGCLHTSSGLRGYM